MVRGDSFSSVVTFSLQLREDIRPFFKFLWWGGLAAPLFPPQSK